MNIPGTIFHWAALVVVCVFAFAYAISLAVFVLLIGAVAVKKLAFWLWEWAGIGWVLLTARRSHGRDCRVAPAGDDFMAFAEAQFSGEGNFYQTPGWPP